jgi:hypothetical protein
MLVGGVIGDEVEDDTDPAGMGIGDQPVEVFECTESRIDIQISYPKSAIGERKIGESQRASTPSQVR